MSIEDAPQDVMHGRTVSYAPNCNYCLDNSTTECTCEAALTPSAVLRPEVTWKNYENFVNLCEATQVAATSELELGLRCRF